MIEQTATNRFMVPPSSKQAALYQELIKGFIHYDQLGKRLIYLAEQAREFKQTDALSELALVLFNLPVERYRIIGQYYLALSICRDGQGDLEQASAMFEKVASCAPMTYRAEALLSLSSIACINQQSDETVRYCLEAANAGDFTTTIKALKGIAILKGIEGHHESAVSDLEKLYPMFKLAPPHLYFDYLNSYAVELSEANRLQEAKQVSALAISSPFSPYYPRWQETYLEVSQKLYKSRSTVRVSIPEPEPEPLMAQPAQQPTLAKILKFPQPKAAELYNGVEVPALTPIQWLAVMLKAKVGDVMTDDDINRFCAAYLDLIITFYD